MLKCETYISGEPVRGCGLVNVIVVSVGVGAACGSLPLAPAH